MAGNLAYPHGRDALLCYSNTAGNYANTFDDVENVKVNSTRTMATTRSRKYADERGSATVRVTSIDLSYAWNGNDTHQAAFRTAYWSGTPLAVEVYDQAAGVTVAGNFVVSKHDHNEELTSPQMIDVALTPSARAPDGTAAGNITIT